MGKTFVCPHCKYPSLERVRLPKGAMYRHDGDKLCLALDYGAENYRRPMGHVTDPVVDAHKAEIVALYQSGKSAAKIGTAIGVTQSTISNALRRWGKRVYFTHEELATLTDQ